MIWYWPELSEIVERTFSISAGLDASTVTPGSTAPDESFTTPVMDAWAAASAGSNSSQRNAETPVLNTRICASWRVACRTGSDGRMVRLPSQLCQGGNRGEPTAYGVGRGFRRTYQAALAVAAAAVSWRRPTHQPLAAQRTAVPTPIRAIVCGPKPAPSTPCSTFAASASAPR